MFLNCRSCFLCDYFTKNEYENCILSSFEARHIRLAGHRSGFDPRNRRVTSHFVSGVKTWVSTLETVYIFWGVVAQWLECRFEAFIACVFWMRHYKPLVPSIWCLCQGT